MAAPRIVQTEDTGTLSVPPLELTFQWDGVRWRHSLDLGSAPLGSSVEWEPERDDLTRVISPAYQQLSTDRLGEVARALLVGMWGKHHGSGAFSMSADAAGVVIDVDVAVRSPIPLAALACTYRINLPSANVVHADESSIGWTVEGPPRGVLRFEAGGEAERVGLAEEGPRATRLQAWRPIDPDQATQRIRYRWRWLQGVDAPSPTKENRTHVTAL